MKKIWPWLIGLGVLLVIGLVVLFAAGLLWSQRTPAYRYPIEEGERVFRDGIWHRPHMGIRTGLQLLNWFLILVIPLGLLGLLVLGIVLLVKYLNRPNRNQIDPPLYQCQNCGREVEPDWKICPYCGETLEKEA